MIHLARVTGHLHEKPAPCKWSPILFQQEHKWSTKHRAMQLIEEYEKQIVIFMEVPGFMDFEGNFNHAIMIRTF
jgi:anthranilate synthase component 1